jgi:two-component system, chemotaxis family, CheB/CheR fusion protein
LAKRRSASQASSNKTKPAAPDESARKTSALSEKSEQVRTESFPIIGIGASAGGLEAFRQLLKYLSTDTGMAFIFVQHLDPTREGILPELLSRSTRMRVSEVRDGIAVEPDQIYVIPPNSNMLIIKGILRLLPREEGRVRHRPIDFFMRSLAKERGSRAIGVILSGTSSDGTMGLEAIKVEGGITFAQDPKSAKYDSMPRSAIAAGHVDFILSPKDIAQELARISRHPYLAPLATTPVIEAQSTEQNGVHKILALLHKAKGIDFREYKANTLYRRIARGIVLNKLEGIEDYASFLRENVVEVEALYQDILINVTNFFRNPETFVILKERIFPHIVKHRAPDESIRIWTLGCSTGEEAYSIAISFAEFTEDGAKQIPVQIFATDLNERAIEKARAGLYSKEIKKDVSPERLRRFFTEAEGGYLVNKPIRDMVVFARQNVFADAPFSRLDLISCRNLLIYLEPLLQKKVFPILHYALKPAGILWLGSSETVGSASDLFAPEDKWHRFYSKKPATARVNFKSVIGNNAHESASIGQQTLRTEHDAQKEADRILLTRYSPASVLINADLEILQFRGSTGTYLEPPSGKASFNLLKMAREGLMLPLRSASQKAKKDNVSVKREGLRVNYDGAFRTVNLEVIPIKGRKTDEPCFLVVFEPVPERNWGQEANYHKAKAGQTKRKTGQAREAARLQEELTATREYMQSLVVQLETANEELQSVNDEVHSSNEELQSINEELETAKGELESSNEKLVTVNDELHNRNLELSVLNDDLKNLLGSVDIPILMLGNDLRILRFTPQAEKVLSLISTDVGRPISDLKLKIDFPDLEELITEVISTVSVKEREVQDRQGRWYSMRVRPYRAQDDRIEGAVVVLIDIDDLKNYSQAMVETIREPRAQEAVRESAERLRFMADSMPQKIFTARPNGEVDYFNPQWMEFTGLPFEQIKNWGWTQFIHPDDVDENIRQWQRSIDTGEPFQIEHRFRRADGEYRWHLSRAHAMRDAKGKVLMWISSNTDIDDMKRAEEERTQLLAREQVARAEAEEANRIKDEFLATVSHELRTPLNAMLGWVRMLRSGVLNEAEVAQALEAIERNAKAQNQLVADLLDTSRISMDKLHFEWSQVELIPVIKAALETVRPAAEAKSVGIRVKLDPTAGPVWGDAARLQQIVWNLLSNAIKYTPQGEYVETRLERVGASVAIIVRDTGEGISPDFLPHVFVPFRQADAATTRRHGGLGIGLAIVRHLVEAHGGQVSAASEGAGQGAIFRVELPLMTLADSGPREEDKDAPEQSTLLTGMRVLLVDDSLDTRVLFSMAFKKHGAEVRVGATVHEALEVLEQWKPDVLVSDIGMPDEDGYDLIRQVRSLPDDRGGQIPAIAVTGFTSTRDAASAIAAGYQMFVIKPIDLSELVAIIRSLTQHFGTSQN